MKNFFISILVILSTFNAPAAEMPVRVDVPTSNILVNEMKLSKNIAKSMNLFFGVSSWMPREIALSSYAEGDVGLERDDFSTVFIGIDFPVFTTAKLDLSLRTGARFTPVRRQAEVEAAGQTRMVTQPISLFSMIAGLQLKPHVLTWDEGFGYFSFDLLPTLVTARESLLGEESTETGLPAEVVLGTFVSIKSFGSRMPDAGFDFSISQMFGKTATVNFSSASLRAAFRFSL